MQIVGVLLGLLSVILIVAPVGAVVVIYQNDLTGLVIPPEINGLITGEGSSLFLNGGGSGDGSSISNLITPTFVSADIDNVANTFTVIVDVTNNINYTFTLNTFSTDVKTAQDNYHLVSVSLSNPPVVLSPGATSRVTIVGAWTQESENYFVQNYAGASSISVQLVNTTIDINGITVTLSEPISVDVPLTLEG
ncbi:MAG TPA: hypothetical protein VLH35_03960 [Candidatus Acidoferrales bacterium]|nr:hypothetical protein [Candidatus Acidoferrales bacterium]